MERYVSYNSNPHNDYVGDCTIRAISELLGDSWDRTYIGIALEGYILKDMPSANRVWGAYLQRCGYRRRAISDDMPDDYTVLDFCIEHPVGKYLLATSGHVVCVCDGKYFDSWDSGNEFPVYYWQKKED